MASLTLLVLQCNRDFLVHKLLDNEEKNWKGGRH